MINNLLKPILTEVLEAVPQAKHSTTAHIDSYLRQYVVNASPEAATIRVSGKTINIEKAILSKLRKVRRVGRSQQNRFPLGQAAWTPLLKQAVDGFTSRVSSVSGIPTAYYYL